MRLAWKSELCSYFESCVHLLQGILVVKALHLKGLEFFVRNNLCALLFSYSATFKMVHVELEGSAFQ